MYKIIYIILVHVVEVYYFYAMTNKAGLKNFENIGLLL